jgi:uncharacterized NAD(P)/FAD-binding protein YdhS
MKATRKPKYQKPTMEEVNDFINNEVIPCIQLAYHIRLHLKREAQQDVDLTLLVDAISTFDPADYP